MCGKLKVHFMKAVNLNLADVWSNLLNKACILLQKDIESISGKKVKIYFDFDSEVSESGKVTGFQSFIYLNGKFGTIIIEAEDEENNQCVIVKIGKFSLNKKGNGISKTGHTEKAPVFFQETSIGDDDCFKEKLLSDEVLWINLELFPSQEFCKHCVNWLFHDVHPVIKKEKKEGIIEK